MAITRKVPNTIHLGGPKVIHNEYAAGAAITPGMLIELYNDTTLKWRAHSAEDRQVTLAVALNQSIQNKLISDAYAAGDLVEAAFLAPGSVFYGLIPSGQDIALGDWLESNGDGKLKEAADVDATDNVARFQALNAPGAVTADTRVIVQVVC